MARQPERKSFHRPLLRSFAGIGAAAHAKPAESRIGTHESKPIIDYFRHHVVSADSLIQRRFRCLLRDFHTVIMLLSGNDAEVAQAVLRTAGAALLLLVLSLLDGKRATLISKPGEVIGGTATNRQRECD